MTTEATTTGAPAGAQPGAAGEQPGTAQTATTLLGGAGAAQEQAANTLLGGAGAAQEQASTPGAEQTPAGFSFPEKFTVKTGADIDFNASAQKLSDAYTNLEKRFGSGDVRPAAVDGYTFTLDGDDANKPFSTAFLADPAAKEFMNKAHELGMTNQQLNFVIGELVNNHPSEAEQVTGMSSQDAQAELQKTWGTPAEYNTNMLAADQAARSLLKDDYTGFINRYGNDPVVIKLLATVGKEMGEDGLRLSGQQVLPAESVHDLMASEAYRNEKHPDHKRVAAQVTAFYEKTYGTTPIV